MKKKRPKIKQSKQIPSRLKVSKGFVLFLILLVTFICFSPCLRNGYTSWDDDVHFLENPVVTSLDKAHIKAVFTTTVLKTYIPLTMLSFATEYHFFGFNPFISHGINLVLHLAVTTIVFFLALRIGLAIPGAGLAALLFAVHPMHVESVAWVVERKDVLYAVFYMLALYCYVVYVEKRSSSFYILAVVLGLLSILAKPMALSLPLIFFVYDWLYRREIKFRIFLEKIPHFLYIIPITWVTYSLHARFPGKGWTESLLIWIWSFVFYLRKFVFPVPLVPLYQLPKPVSLFNAQYLFSLLAFLAVLIMVWRLKKNRWFIFSMLTWFLSIFFLLRFDEQADVGIVADRFMYLPSLGFCLWAGVSGSRIARRLKGNKAIYKNLAAGFLIMMLLFLSIKTFLQCQVWRNSRVLWSYVMRFYPDTTIAYNNRGQDYLQKKEYDKALADFNKAIELNPQNSEAYNNRGLIFLRKGDLEEALNQSNLALKAKEDNERAYNNRGIIYQELGRYKLALKDYDKAIKLNPYCTEAYINRGNLLTSLGRFKEALASYDKALEIHPHNHYAHFGKGMVYSWDKGQYEKAIEQFTLSLKSNPQYERAYFYRSVAYKERGDYKRALDDALKAKSLGFYEQGHIEQIQRHLTEEVIP